MTILNTASANITMDDVTFHFIHKLLPKYNSYTNNLQIRKMQLTFEELHEFLHDYEGLI